MDLNHELKLDQLGRINDGITCDKAAFENSLAINFIEVLY